MTAYLIETIQSATRDARDLYQTAFLLIEALDGTLSWLDDIAGRIKGLQNEAGVFRKDFEGKIGPLVQDALKQWRERLAEDAKKESMDYVA